MGTGQNNGLLFLSEAASVEQQPSTSLFRQVDAGFPAQAVKQFRSSADPAFDSLVVENLETKNFCKHLT
jgi:hypothetical protein